MVALPVLNSRCCCCCGKVHGGNGLAESVTPVGLLGPGGGVEMGGEWTMRVPFRLVSSCRFKALGPFPELYNLAQCWLPLRVGESILLIEVDGDRRLRIDIAGEHWS